eukprot:TRINITY_DN2128_c0_g1_i3.p5 TRINITY_DN2128_c0_g1~~TRINITY_DN2128_c0_g1_i3.p5  ORF type:complete len:126 (-),score=7.08 TRINITY_DN2128_c0_g1_i3:728-1105(-)
MSSIICLTISKSSFSGVRAKFFSNDEGDMTSFATVVFFMFLYVEKLNDIGDSIPTKKGLHALREQSLLQNYNLYIFYLQFRLDLQKYSQIYSQLFTQFIFNQQAQQSGGAAEGGFPPGVQQIAQR